MTKKDKKYIYKSGRRKEASARVRLFKGSDHILVNDLPIGKYFPGLDNEVLWKKPFYLTDTLGKYYATIKVVGGGKRGQLSAVVHGISRALCEIDEKYKLVLKKAGLLTRDAREKERRKVGTGGKARRKKQSPKR